MRYVRWILYGGLIAVLILSSGILIEWWRKDAIQAEVYKTDIHHSAMKISLGMDVEDVAKVLGSPAYITRGMNLLHQSVIKEQTTYVYIYFQFRLFVVFNNSMKVADTHMDYYWVD